MIESSTAFAEARQISRMSIGTQRLDRRMDWPTALGLYASQVTSASKGQWEVDLPIDMVEVARVSDIESLYERFLRQFLAYWRLHASHADPAWTAVTGYYCAFYGAQTLLGLVGEGSRTLPAFGQAPGGLYRIQARTSPYSDHYRLSLKPVGMGSHKALWSQLVALLDHLIGIPALDASSDLVLRSLRQLVIGPPRLAAVRNNFNYSIDFDLRGLGTWLSEFPACMTSADLERRLQVAAPTHEAQRFELVALGSGALAKALYDEYLARTASADLRPRNRRRELLAQDTTEDHPARAWF